MIQSKPPETQPTPAPIAEKIPEKYLKVITETTNKKNGLINMFVNLSFQLVNLQSQQKDTADKINNTTESLKAKISDAFSKMKLKKKTNYTWTYNGVDSFIGTLRPEPKKEEKK